MQLAIDTSTDTASLALVADGQVFAELTWRCGQNHTTQLLPNLNYLLEQNKLSLQSLTGIIVARGPGSFNGLRVGVSTAKGLAFSLGIPIVGVSSLEAEAYPYAQTALPVCPVFNAGRGEIATALYQKKRNRWQEFIPEHITTVEDICSQLSTRTIFVGEYVPSVASRLLKLLGKKAVIPSSLTGLRRASYLAELGVAKLNAGKDENPATLQPVYLRRPSITKAKHL